MRTKADKEFAAFPQRGRYEEGRELMNLATEKIADKYNLAVLCMTSRSDQPDHSLHIQNMSVETMASFVASILTETKNKQFMKRVLKKVPDRVWIKALGFRFALFYMAMGAGVWAACEILLSLARRLTVN